MTYVFSIFKGSCDMLKFNKKHFDIFDKFNSNSFCRQPFEYFVFKPSIKFDKAAVNTEHQTARFRIF